MNTTLQTRRMQAAVASKGISSNVIYQLVKNILKRTQLSGNLLEYGAGTGSLIKQLVEMGYPEDKITGADILDRPSFLSKEINWIQGDLNNSLNLPNESYDVIISTEVIEHLENPRATYREFHRLLRPAGTVIVTTPNQESIRSLCGLLGGGHFVSFLGVSYPAHITALLRKDFERICLESGFSPPAFYYTDAGGIPKLPHIRWQNLSFGAFKGRLFSDNIVVVSRKLN